MVHGNSRTCGTCTACCKTHPIRELEKPAGGWCPHCHIGHGCRIYESRPDSCREFECQWLKGTGDDGDRPDKSRIVIDFIRYQSIGDTVVFFEVIPGGLKRKLVDSVRKAALEKRYAVLSIPVAGDAHLIIPHGRTTTEDFVLESGKTVRIERL